MSEQIYITVAGKAGVGKSRVSCFLKQILQGAGFDVEMNLLDGDVETMINAHLIPAINSIAELRTIVINEQQLPSNYS